MKFYLNTLMLLFTCIPSLVFGQKNISVSGVFPQLAMVANHSPRTEAGTGGLMPWANRLG